MSPIIQYLQQARAFEYISTDKNFKEGTEVFFVVDNNYKSEVLQGEQPIFLAVKNKENNIQIIGDLPLARLTGSFIYGLNELREDIKQEYNKTNIEQDKLFIYSKSSSIAQLMLGIIPFGTELNNLKNILNENNTDF
jgi:hypothetical protein